MLVVLVMLLNMLTMLMNMTKFVVITAVNPLPVSLYVDFCFCACLYRR